MAEHTFKLSKSVEESAPVVGVSLVTSRMGEGPIATIAGSFRGGRNIAANMMVAEVLTELFSEGTKKRSKRAIEDTLEGMGASIAFSCGEDRISFSAKCLSRNVGDVISMITEEIAEPALQRAALLKVKSRLRAEIEQAEDSTRFRATDAYLSSAFPEGHPHHMPPAEARIALLDAVTRKDVAAHHADIFGKGSLIIVAVGDVDHASLAKQLRLMARSWPKREIQAPDAPVIKLAKPSEVAVLMPGKPNVDVVMGAPLPIGRKDPEYFSLVAALGILGGREGFNGRLMQVVREKLGLTYGIYAFMDGFEAGRAGYWYVWGTFGPKTLQQGIDATRKEIGKLIARGVTPAELAVRKNIVKGSYAIALGATESRAVALLRNAEDGRPATFLDEYAPLMQRVTVAGVNKTLQKVLDPSALITAFAGGFDTKSK